MRNKKEVSIEKDKKTRLAISLVVTIMLICGIPLIIVGATKSIWIVLGIGIAFTVIGFYGTPIAWTTYANFKVLKRIVDCVNEENLTTTQEIARQLQIDEKQVKQQVTLAIKKKYITGFLFDGSTLTANNKEASKKRVFENKCPNCGANMQQEGGVWRCLYCNSKFEI